MIDALTGLNGIDLLNLLTFICVVMLTVDRVATAFIERGR